MIGRKVRAPYQGVIGVVIEWEPLGAALCDVKVRREDGSACWYASSDLRPRDGKGPLPDRRAAQLVAKAELDRAIEAIAERWNK